ncbi:MAG: site-specific integrase [Rhodobiaceae bacterium]|nr:site-specific integrase [Verrucomicrobiae bacterium]MCC0016712.1 site-specific integrase [Rhodobiaceae bacterium]MCC0042137.1 site-specific integrase [Rhodobiaceae bacterium]
MKRHNADNERVKRRYVQFLEEAEGYSEASTDQVLVALDHYEAYTRRKPFKAFHIEQAIGFKRDLMAQVNPRTGKPLSKATINSRLNACRKFFLWLAGQPGYRQRISYSDANYFRLTDKDVRVARTHGERPFPSLEQVHHVLGVMPAETDIQKRDRALIAFLVLTGVRDGALASLKLKHVDLKARKVVQDAREVATKFSKTFTTTFFPVGGDALVIFEDWFGHLQTGLLFGLDDPLFPATAMGQDDNRHFVATGLKREHWSNAGPIRRIVGDAFEAAGLPRFHPHGFSKTIAQLGERRCRTPEEFKAWSQNMGHDHVMTTFRSYGTVAPDRQAEIIGELEVQDSTVSFRDGEPDAETVKWVVKHVLRTHKA